MLLEVRIVVIFGCIVTAGEQEVVSLGDGNVVFLDLSSDYMSTHS